MTSADGLSRCFHSLWTRTDRWETTRGVSGKVCYVTTIHFLRLKINLETFTFRSSTQFLPNKILRSVERSVMWWITVWMAVGSDWLELQGPTRAAPTDGGGWRLHQERWWGEHGWRVHSESDPLCCSDACDEDGAEARRGRWRWGSWSQTTPVLLNVYLLRWKKNFPFPRVPSGLDAARLFFRG